MKNTCTFTSADASSLFKYVGKTATVHTKHKHEFKGIVHTVDPITKRYITLVMQF